MLHNDKVPELSEKEFNDFIKEDLVLVDFFADWRSEEHTSELQSH